MLDKLKEWLFGSEEEPEEEGKAISGTRKLTKQGSSYYLNIPKEWFDKNDLKPEEVGELRYLANSDVVIINPEKSEEIQEKLEKKTYEVYKKVNKD